MSRSLSILKTIGCWLLLLLRAFVQYRTLLLPSLVGFVAAAAAAMGRKIDIGKFQELVDKTGMLATAIATVIGAAMDAKSKQVQNQIQNTAGQASAALNETRDTVNTINPAVQTRDAIAPPLPPVEIKPTEKTQ